MSSSRWKIISPRRMVRGGCLEANDLSLHTPDSTRYLTWSASFMRISATSPFLPGILSRDRTIRYSAGNIAASPRSLTHCLLVGCCTFSSGRQIPLSSALPADGSVRCHERQPFGSRESPTVFYTSVSFHHPHLPHSRYPVSISASFPSFLLDDHRCCETDLGMTPHRQVAVPPGGNERSIRSVGPGLLRAGRAALLSGDFGTARRCIESASLAVPRIPDVAFGGLLRRADSLLAISGPRYWARIRFASAILYRQIELMEEAIDETERALCDNPQSEDVPGFLVETFTFKSRPGTAAKYRERLQELHRGAKQVMPASK